MRRCPFEGNPEKPCAVPANLDSLVVQSCQETKYGHACAAIVAQALVLLTLDPETKVSKVDEKLGLIGSQFRLTRTPDGDAPEHIRERVGKITFPLRQNRPLADGKTLVHHQDLLWTLLNSEELEAANWYDKYFAEINSSLRESGQGFEYWAFEADEGVISELFEPKTSLAQYDTSFHMGSSALWNCHFPPLLIARGWKSETAPIKGYFAPES